MFLCPPIFRINAYYLYDHLGNTRVVYNVTPTSLCNGEGAIQYNLENVLDYYPYGKTLRKFTGSNGQERFLTTQHERDEETGLDYRGARFYDADIARFLSLDPLAADFAAWSAYNYVLGNPVKFVDPDGKAPDPPYTTNGLYYIQEGFRRMFQAAAGTVDKLRMAVYSKKSKELIKTETKIGSFTITHTTKTEAQASVEVGTNLEQVFIPQNNTIVISDPVVEAKTKTSVSLVKQTDVKATANGQFVKGTNKVQGNLSSGKLSSSNQVSAGVETKSAEASVFIKNTQTSDKSTTETGIQVKAKIKTGENSTTEYGGKIYIQHEERQ